MLILLTENITEHEKNQIHYILAKSKYDITNVKTQHQNFILCSGKRDIEVVCNVIPMSGVSEVHLVPEDYKLVSKNWKKDNSSIDLGDGVIVGGHNNISIIAGPCFVANEAQMQEIVYHFIRNRIRILRAAVYKPINYPYALSGIGVEGLKMMHSMCAPYGIKILSEVMEVSQINEMMPYIDIFQVGARNSQNLDLLDALGEIDKPVLIKRSINGTVEDLLHSAERIYSKGNEKLVLCEIGIRTFENAVRNTFDINAIQILKEKTHLPVIAEPSHGVGIRNYVLKMALAALISGADGIMYEVHEKPDEVLLGNKQILNFLKSEQLVKKIKCLSVSNLCNLTF